MYLIMSSLADDLIMTASSSVEYEENENVVVHSLDKGVYAIPKAFYSKVVEFTGEFNFDEFVDGKFVFDEAENTIKIDPKWVEPEPDPTYGVDPAIVEQIQADYREKLLKEVQSYGYNA